MAEEDQSKLRTNIQKSYLVRKECIKRKTMELATLCDIKVCTIITGPQGELQTWPEDLDAVKQVLDLYAQNTKPEKHTKGRESSEASKQEEEEAEEEQDLLTLVESKLEAVYKRIRFLENKNVVGKGKKLRIE